MSFTFKWPRFSDDFHRDAREMLEAALNKGNKPPIIADRIEVVELEMGTQPPELEIRDIGDLTLDQFRGIFRLSYEGDAHIVLRTKVQANPLNHKKPDIHMLGGSRGMLAAHQPLVVPMLLRLSHFKLNAYVVLVVSKQKGITLVFKTDPLQNVDVNSTFDSIAVIQKYIQHEIEGQLREMFREDLPSIIHRLSQRWVTGKTKVEAPYLSKQQTLGTVPERQESISNPDASVAGNQYLAPMVGFHPTLRRQPLSRIPSLQRMQSTPGPWSAPSTSSAPSSLPSTSTDVENPPHEPPTTFPEIENFDPTYGLRPDDLPAKSGYSGFGRLFGAPKGLGDLAEEPTEGGTEWDEADSFDMVDWEETVNFTPPPSVVPEEVPEYETLPAVGGGTITRPRIYHSQSIIRSPTDADSPSAAAIMDQTQPDTPVHPVSGMSTPGHGRMLDGSITAGSTPSHFRNPYFPSWPARPHVARGQTSPPWMLKTDSPDPGTRLTQSARALSFTGATAAGSGFAHRALSPDSGFLTSPAETGTYPSQSSSAQTQTPSTPSEVQGKRSPTYIKVSHQHNRRRSISPGSLRSSENMSYGSPPNLRSAMDADGNIVLRPGLNNTISQLSTLSHSNHTLSPYTRSLEHFTVRSVPHRVSGSAPTSDRQPTKAKRKRTYRLGGKKPPDFVEETVEQRGGSSSPPPPSEFEASDVEHYFRVPLPSLRRRASYQDL